ncbi:MAG TPA: acyl-CoA thioesterase/bile acid-CoA:amino acid N-acyltransferase family protein [Longimicrobium sp.]|nr:acyl-CoA thioesterase/bile acid-CoA:amino acid N-acyltransferase family protein [Longimicrobium sp.]
MKTILLRMADHTRGARLLGFAALLTCAVAPHGASAQRLFISPDSAMVDEPVRIMAEGLAPGTEAEIRLRWADAPGAELVSSAWVRADGAGRIDLQTQAPDSGSYGGVDGAGLLWSMAPPSAPASIRHAWWSPPEPIRLRAELRVAGRVVDERSVTRRLLGWGVRVEEVRDSGIVARLYRPADAERPLPVVLVLSGSEGGFDDLRASLLAAHGFAALTVAYFRAPGLPDELFEIPVERVLAALAWVRKRPGLDAGRVAVLGASKGAELALVAASRIPELRAVVGYAPTDVVNPGINQQGRTGPRSSWTWGGAPLPFMELNGSPEFEAQFRGPPPYRLRPLYEASRADTAALARAAIPVERIRGPVMLVTGEDDQMIPSTPSAVAVMRRLAAARHPYPDQHLSYPDAGHVILAPRLPTPPRARLGPWSTGGTPEGYARADAASWPAVLRFLEDALR